MSSPIYKFLPLILCVLLFQSAIAQAQTGNKEHLAQLQMNDALDPPQNILGAKSIVLISVPTGTAFGEWKNYASELQTFFGEVGIDAVAYFNVDRQRTVAGQVQALPKYILDRKIDNLIFYIVGEADKPSILGMGPFNSKPDFYDQGAIFWTRQFNKPESVFNELDALFKTGAFERTSLLVNDSPEFFDFSKPSFANNYASFPPELATKKIAIPILKPYPAGVGTHLLTADHYFNPQENARLTAEWNAALDALVADSLMNMQRVDMDKTTEALLRRDGFTHVLNFVDADSEFIYNLFKYKNRQEVDAARMVKFYLRDLRNRNIFLARSWEVSDDWQASLDLFVAQIRKELLDQGG